MLKEKDKIVAIQDGKSGPLMLGVLLLLLLLLGVLLLLFQHTRVVELLWSRMTEASKWREEGSSVVDVIKHFLEEI